MTSQRRYTFNTQAEQAIASVKRELSALDPASQHALYAAKFQELVDLDDAHRATHLAVLADAWEHFILRTIEELYAYNGASDRGQEFYDRGLNGWLGSLPNPFRQHDSTPTTKETSMTTTADKTTPAPDLDQFGRCLQAQRDIDELFEQNLDATHATNPALFDGDGEPRAALVDHIQTLVAKHPNAADIQTLMIAQGINDAIERVIGERA